MNPVKLTTVLLTLILTGVGPPAYAGQRHGAGRAHGATTRHAVPRSGGPIGHAVPRPAGPLGHPRALLPARPYFYPFGLGFYYGSPWYYGHGLGYPGYRYGYPRYGYGYPWYGYGGYDYGYGYGYSGSTLAPGQPYGRMRIEGAPSDAQVFVDGYYAGIVDDFDGVRQYLALEPGPHQIEIRDPEFETLLFDVNLGPGQRVTYRARMRPLQP